MQSVLNSSVLPASLTLPAVFVVMGVSGCGKSTVAEALAERIDGEFLDADDFHPASNIEKMRQGIPLTAEDRAGWLASLASALDARVSGGRPTVLACSALQESYRRVLRVHAGVRFLYLKGSYDVIETRMRSRSGHFMNPVLLKSQFDLLEEPDCGPGSDAAAFDLTLPVDTLVGQALTAFPPRKIPGSLDGRHPGYRSGEPGLSR